MRAFKASNAVSVESVHVYEVKFCPRARRTANVEEPSPDPSSRTFMLRCLKDICVTSSASVALYVSKRGRLLYRLLSVVTDSEFESGEKMLSICFLACRQRRI